MHPESDTGQRAVYIIIYCQLLKQCKIKMKNVNLQCQVIDYSDCCYL